MTTTRFQLVEFEVQCPVNQIVEHEVKLNLVLVNVCRLVQQVELAFHVELALVYQTLHSFSAKAKQSNCEVELRTCTCIQESTWSQQQGKLEKRTRNSS